MNILISFCNVRVPSAPKLALFDPVASHVSVMDVSPSLAPTGITGLAQSGGFVYVVGQLDERPPHGRNSILHVFTADAFTHIGSYVFKTAADVHSICVQGDRAYVVSTGTDEVVELQLHDGRVVAERAAWQAQQDSRTDVNHLNAVVEWGGDLVVCGFGPRTGQARSSATDGFIFNISTQEFLQRGVQQPHSLCVVDDDLAYCESKTMLLRTVGSDTTFRLPGYARGLCTIGSQLYAGTSVGRTVSRSQDTVNNPADGGVPAGTCSITRVTAAGSTSSETFDLGVRAHEIYDLLPVENTEAWPQADEVDWRDATMASLWTSLDQETVRARRSAARATEVETASRRRSEELARIENALLGLTDVVQAQHDRLQQLEQQLDGLASQSRDVQATLAETNQVAANRMLGLEAALTTMADAVTLLEDGGKAPEVAYRKELRQELAALLPPGAVVLAVGKGEDVLRVNGVETWHFPQGPSGVPSGYKPGDSLAAIGHLEALRLRGAEFVLFPRASLWWLDYYAGLRDHLERRYACVFDRPELGVMFDLGARPQRGEQALLLDLVEQCRDELGRGPAILDWFTGADVSQRLPAEKVFSPPVRGGQLPYVDASVEIVLVPSGDAEAVAEARRVATWAVAQTVDDEDRQPNMGLEVQCLWRKDPAATTSSASVVVALSSSGRAPDTLSEVISGLPKEFTGSVVLVGSDAELAAVRDIEIGGDCLHRVQVDASMPMFARFDRGFQETTGDIVIFILDSVLPLPGWFSSMAGIFEHRGDAGVVGGKVLLPDGRLYSAGGVESSPEAVPLAGYGEYQPAGQGFNHVRRVDFMPGELIATRRSVYDEVGGFTSGLGPDSAPDEEYCRRASQAGYRTYCHPDVRAVLVAPGHVDLPRGAPTPGSWELRQPATAGSNGSTAS